MTNAAETTIAFIDLAGFTALTEAHGDEAAADLAEHFAELVVGQLAEGDRLIKTMGDAVMLASQTTDAGVSLVERVVSKCARTQRFTAVRAGIHTGPVVERGGDLFGATVNIAARVAGAAGGGQVLITETVARAVDTAQFCIRDLGMMSLKNVAQPVRVFELALPDTTPILIDPVCRMRISDRPVGRLSYDGVDYWFCSFGCAATFASAPARYANPQPQD